MRADAQKGKATVLMFAAQSGSTECLRLLMDCGADKEAENEVRVTDASSPVSEEPLFVYFIDAAAFYWRFCELGLAS